MSMENTTITLKRVTKSRLDDMGGKTDSYDDIVNRAIDSHMNSFKTVCVMCGTEHGPNEPCPGGVHEVPQ
ncbi:MAG: hypothetical protein KAJ39_06450 [Gammaproteobacteria bacterium]|nr:hypothetical protein [Gammaproteobacteria bacterium]